MEDIQRQRSSSILGEVLPADGTIAPELEPVWTALPELVAARDPVAVYALYQHTHRLVYTLILRLTGSTRSAAELSPGVFAEVWARLLRDALEPLSHRERKAFLAGVVF